jgi:carbon monoxide dehydrogenase subunit G
LVAAAPDAVLAQLRDIEFVVECLPGLVPGSLVPGQDGGYVAQMKTTAVGVTAIWDLSIGYDAPPTRDGIAVELSGAERRLNLSMTGTADVAIAPEDRPGAAIDYRGHVTVEGRLAATGAPIIRRLVSEILDRFVTALAAPEATAPSPPVRLRARVGAWARAWWEALCAFLAGHKRRL